MAEERLFHLYEWISVISEGVQIIWPSMKHFQVRAIRMGAEGEEDFLMRTLEFSASDKFVEMLAWYEWGPRMEFECYGRMPIRAFRLGPYAVWLGTLSQCVEGSVATPFQDGFMALIDGRKYDLAAGTGSWQELPQLQFNELAWRFTIQLSEDARRMARKEESFLDSFENPLYREPKHPEDRFGDKLLRRVHGYFSSPGPECVDSLAPRESREIRIYLDQPGVHECVWRVGETDHGTAMKFERYPFFPVWLCGPAIDKLVDRCGGLL